jgi:hypothetical protein
LISIIIDTSDSYRIYNKTEDGFKDQNDKNAYERMILIGKDEYGDSYRNYGGMKRLFKHLYTDYYYQQENIFHKMVKKFDSTSSEDVDNFMKICDLLKKNGFDFNQYSLCRSDNNKNHTEKMLSPILDNPLFQRVSLLDYGCEKNSEIVKFIIEETKDKKFDIEIIERRLESFVNFLGSGRKENFGEEKYYNQYIKFHIDFFETCIKYGLNMNSKGKSGESLKEIITSRLNGKDEIKYFGQILK